MSPSEKTPVPTGTIFIPAPSPCMDTNREDYKAYKAHVGWICEQLDKGRTVDPAEMRKMVELAGIVVRENLEAKMKSASATPQSRSNIQRAEKQAAGLC